MSQNSALLRLRLPSWARPTHPIYRQEVQRQGANRGVGVLQLIFLPLLFAVTGLSLLGTMSLMLPIMVSTGADSAATGALALMLTILLTIQVGAGALANVLVIAQTAPTISGEIELQSWRLLRATVLPLHEIVLAKFSAALFQLRLILGGLMILRIISTVTAILVFAYAVAQDAAYQSGQFYYAQLKWLPLLVPLLAVTVAYLFQPAIQFVLNGANGLLASAYARTRGQAIAGAFMGRLGLWAFTSLINMAVYSGLAYVYASWSQPQFSPIESYRSLPTPSQETALWVLCLIIAGYAIAVVAGQVGIALAALGLVLRRARHLGV